MDDKSFTIQDVLAWARTKNPNEEYKYCSPWECAVAQFLNETGRTKHAAVDPYFWADTDPEDPYRREGENYSLDSKIDECANPRSGGVRVTEHTFGAFAERLELAVAHEQ